MSMTQRSDAHSHPHTHAPAHSHSHSQSPGQAHPAAQAPATREGAAHAPGQARAPLHPATAKRAGTYSKVFRWQPETPGGPLPVRVELVGSLTHWEKKPMKYDRANGLWQLTLENIPGNCTHNYMVLVNGRPAKDKNSDGLAVPHTDQEKQYQIETPRGPRVFMLFSQAK